MGLVAKEVSGAGFDPIPEGTYEAVCYAVIDLGTHYSDVYQKAAHKVLLQWEVPECRITVERNGKDVDMPRAISKRYTMSLHKKAGLRHDLEAWRGKAFTEEELAGFDVSKIVGAGCLLGIVHEVGKDGRTYANISSILALPKIKGRTARKPENEAVVFAIDDDADAGFDIPASLPEWVVKVIQESQEWRGEKRQMIAMPVRVAEERQRDDDDELMPF